MDFLSISDLRRAAMNPEQIREFKRTARRHTFQDDITNAVVVVYRKPTGEILIDSIKYPSHNLNPPVKSTSR